MSVGKRLIYADALKSYLERLEASGGHKYYRKGVDDTLHFHMPKIIDEQPTVEAVEVVHGRWVHVPSSDMMTGKAYKCSECNKMRYGSYVPNYCQNCGARMDGGDAHA